MLWGEFIIDENKRFTAGIDDFLNKFAASSSLPIDLVELLVNLKGHCFLENAKSAMRSLPNWQENGCPTPPVHFLSMEHSSVDFLGKPKSIQWFHESLLELISWIETKTECRDIEIEIRLNDVVFPPVGSAIAEIIRFK